MKMLTCCSLGCRVWSSTAPALWLHGVEHAVCAAATTVNLPALHAAQCSPSCRRAGLRWGSPASCSLAASAS